MASISTKIARLENQLKEVKREKRQLEKKLEKVKEKERRLQEQLDKIISVIENISNENKKEFGNENVSIQENSEVNENDNYKNNEIRVGDDLGKFV